MGRWNRTWRCCLFPRVVRTCCVLHFQSPCSIWWLIPQRNDVVIHNFNRKGFALCPVFRCTTTVPPQECGRISEHKSDSSANASTSSNFSTTVDSIARNGIWHAKRAYSTSYEDNDGPILILCIPAYFPSLHFTDFTVEPEDTVAMSTTSESSSPPSVTDLPDDMLCIIFNMLIDPPYSSRCAPLGATISTRNSNLLYQHLIVVQVCRRWRVLALHCGHESYVPLFPSQIYRDS